MSKIEIYYCAPAQNTHLSRGVREDSYRRKRRMGYTWDNDGQYCEQKSAHENHSENDFLPIGLMQWKRLSVKDVGNRNSSLTLAIIT